MKQLHVSEALALKQRMQLNDRDPITPAIKVSEALALKQRMQQGIVNFVNSAFTIVSEALALKQRMQLT